MEYCTYPTTISFVPFDWHNAQPIEWRKKAYLMNADVKSVVPIGGKWMGRFTWHIEPFFKVRIMRIDLPNGDSSAPVRTPSYMPGMSFLYTLNGSRNNVPKLFNESRRVNWYMKTRFFHHSNGQNATIELDTLGVANIPSQPGYINRFDGDFGINLHWEQGIGLVTNQRTGPYGLENQLSAYLSVESPIDALDMTTQLKTARYGRERINLKVGDIIGWVTYDEVQDTSGNWYQVTESEYNEYFRVYLEASYITQKKLVTGPLYNETAVTGWMKQRFNVSLTAHWRIFGTSGSTLFVNTGYYGSDPYNTYYQRSIWFIRGGLGFGYLNYKQREDLAIPVPAP